jgi:adenylate kinase
MFFFKKRKYYSTIALEADDEILVARLLDRGKHQEELTIKMRKNRNRYQEYNEKQPLMGYYNEQEKFHAVNGIGSIDEITLRLSAVIDNL